MQPAQIAELLEPFVVQAQSPRPDAQSLFQDISTYIDILLRWNAKMNLTAIRQPEEIVTRHFGESLFAARHLFPSHVETAAIGCLAERSSVHGADRGFTRGEDQGPKSGQTVADLGSGAGFPGIPIKLWAPQISLTLIESNQKKATFLREIARALTLTDINIQNARAETISDRFGVVTLRAVERFDSILPTAASLLAPGARLALLIGEDQVPATHHTLQEMAWSDPLPIPQSQSRVLLIGQST